MKNFGLVLILALSASSAWASKSRVSSLQGANHLVDTQTVFTNPAHINLLTPYITMEMGTAGAGAEGGFTRKLSSGNMLGIYLGHDNTNDLRDGTTYLKQQNPIELTYGMGNMGLAASLSTVDNKKSGTKETTLVGKYGMVMDGGKSLYAHLTLVSSAEKKGTPDSKMNASPVIAVGGAKDDGDTRFFGSLLIGQAKSEAGTVSTNYKDTGLQLGWLDHSLKNKEADIYYGLRLDYANRDVEGKKITAMALPAYLGLEYNVNSWAVFRGSVSQNILVGSSKDETATSTDADGINSNTTVAGGLGLKYNSITLDGSLAAATSGNVNGTSFLTTASVTYNF